jgi:hypothetical protein
LTLLVLLGHACELPVAAVTAHVHDATGHAHDHPADESQVSCEAVAGIRPSTCASVPRDLDAAASPAPIVGKAVSRVVATARPAARTVARGQPLFLLHASLLI